MGLGRGDEEIIESSASAFPGGLHAHRQPAVPRPNDAVPEKPEAKAGITALVLLHTLLSMYRRLLPPFLSRPRFSSARTFALAVPVSLCVSALSGNFPGVYCGGVHTI